MEALRQHEKKTRAYIDAKKKLADYDCDKQGRTMDMSWLISLDGQKGFFCSYCRASCLKLHADGRVVNCSVPGKACFIKVGSFSQNAMESITDHVYSDCHARSLLQLKQATCLEKTIDPPENREFDLSSLKKRFREIIFLSREGIAMSKFTALNELLLATGAFLPEIKGLRNQEDYLSPRVVNEQLEAIARGIRFEQQQKVNNSPVCICS
jgi:hypothetical protein